MRGVAWCPPLCLRLCMWLHVTCGLLSRHVTRPHPSLCCSSAQPNPSRRHPAPCPTQQVPLSEEEQAATAAKPDRMAVGVEGGFNVDAKKYKIETDWVSLC